MEQIKTMEQTTSQTKSIKVAIIEDERDIREGLGMLIGYTDGFECVGKYGSMEEALTSIRHRTPDVVLSTSDCRE
jgi:YesN/AraC family two-component response regulator